jgi:hypothetical protein
MIKAIFADVYVQTFPQASRYHVYVILLHFLLHRLDGKNKRVHCVADDLLLVL